MLIDRPGLYQPIICFAVLAALVMCGCGKLKPKSLPAPLRDNPVYSVEGRVGRVWGGDNFEFTEDSELSQMHYILIQGIDTPKSGQPFSTAAHEYLIESTRGKKVRIDACSRDDMMREIGDVFIISPADEPNEEPINVGLDLIQKGLGWYDGNEFKDAVKFQAAQAEAREKKIGLWSQENPVAPWDFVNP